MKNFLNALVFALLLILVSFWWYMPGQSEGEDVALINTIEASMEECVGAEMFDEYKTLVTGVDLDNLDQSTSLKIKEVSDRMVEIYYDDSITCGYDNPVFSGLIMRSDTNIHGAYVVYFSKSILVPNE